MDSWDNPVVFYEVVLHKVRDGQSKITFDDYMPNDLWLETL